MAFVLTPPVRQKLIDFRVKNLAVFKAFYDDAALIARIKGKSYAIENPLVKPMRPTKVTAGGYLSPGLMPPEFDNYSEYTEGFNVQYVLQLFQNSFIVDKMDLELVEPAHALIPRIKSAQDGIVKAVEEMTRDIVLDGAHTVTGGTWVAADGTINPAQIEADIRTMKKAIKNSVIWTPEDFQKMTLYVPAELEEDFKAFESNFRSITIEQLIKKYVVDIKYTPLLENTAVMMIKNDPYALTKVEHAEESFDKPKEKYEETEDYIAYSIRVRTDVKVVPDPNHPEGKTYRIIKVDNIIA